MREFYSINRHALLIRPSQEMVTWVNGLFGGDPEVTYSEAIAHDELDILLIPEADSIEESLDWVKENCEDILRYALEDWTPDENQWPKPLNWDLFERFLEYSLQTMVIDTVTEEEDEADLGEWN